MKVVKRFVHPKYNKPKAVSHDLALLKLAKEVDLGEYTPACLPKSRKNYLGRRAWVYGKLYAHLFPWLKIFDRLILGDS